MPIMKDSRLKDDWITKVVQDNPIHINKENGNLITGPVRLSFVELFEAKHPMNDTSKPKVYSATLLWTPLQTQMIWQGEAWAAIYAAAAAKFPGNFGADRQPFGLHFPLHPQDQKQNYSGYTPGALYAACNSQFKPAIVDAGMNQIVDPARVYSGIWAICACNIWTFDVRTKKGVSLGLQSVMIIADDDKLGGGSSDPVKDFAGTRVSANYDPAAAFGSGAVNTGAPPPPPGAMLPPGTSVGGAPRPSSLQSMLDDDIPY